MSDLGNKEIFSKNLKYYMTINNKTRNDICKDLNFKYTTFTDWYNGNIYPRIDKIEMLANYFRIEKSDLIEQRLPNNFSISNEIYIKETIKRFGQSSNQLLNNYNKLNELGKQTANIYVEGLAEIPKYIEKEKNENTQNTAI